MTNTTKYRIMIDSYRVRNKTKVKPGKVKINIMNKPAQELSLHEIATKLEDGHTVILSELGVTEELKAFMEREGRTYPTARKEAWISQQLFGVDLDNEYSVVDPLNKVNETVKCTGNLYLEKHSILQLCTTKNIAPCLIYESLSSKKDHRKYRVLFALNRPVTTLKEQERVAAALVEMFTIDGVVVADKKCTDPGRLFYAAKNVVYKDYISVNDSDYLLNAPVTYKKLRYEESTTVSPASSPKASSKTTAKKTIQNLVGLSLSEHYQEPNETVAPIKNKEWLQLKNVLISNVKSFLSLTASRDEEDTGTDQTIASSYYKYVRELFGSTVQALSPYVPIDRKDFHVRISSIPLDVLFGLPHNEPFSCILPGHEDSNPSARIFNSEEKSSYYCSSCCYDHTLDVFDLFAIYLPELSKTEIRRRISTLLNITESTKWQRDQRLLLQEYANYLYEPDNAGIGSLREDSPYLYKRMNRSSWLIFLHELYTQAAIHVHDKCITKDEKPNYIAELSRISEIMYEKKRGGGKTKGTLQKHLHMSALLGFIEYVPDDADNPLVQLGLRRRQEENERRIEENKTLPKEERKPLIDYRANVIRLNPTNSPQILLEAERRLKLLDEKKFKFGKADEREAYKWLPSDIGVSVDDHYVQDKEKNKKDPKYEAFLKKLVSAMKSLNKKGVRYFTFDELLTHRIIKEFRFEGKSLTRKDKKTALATVTPELLEVQGTYEITNYSSYYRELYTISKEEERKKKLKPNTNFFALTEDVKKKPSKQK